MNEKQVYWVWLQNALGAGSGKIRRILDDFVTIRQFQEAGPSEWKLWRIFTEKEQQAFLNFTLTDAEKRIKEQEHAGVWILTPEDPLYPDKLREIYDLPAVLYGKGQMPDLDSTLSIAMVGTRRASRIGLETARNFGRGLAQHCVPVVSGGALGIDTAAHQGVLSADGVTLCVLGCGIGYDYLQENDALRNQILKRGALLSEYPVGTPPTKASFPVRNRLISGLCDGTLVVEADMGSGSLITARDALEQDRDVFAVPGSALQKSFRGTNNLIKSGAKMTTAVRDILEEYTRKYPEIAGSAPFGSSRRTEAPTKEEKQERTVPFRRDPKEQQAEQWSAALEKSVRTGVWTIPLDQLPSESEVAGSRPESPVPPMPLPRREAVAEPLKKQAAPAAVQTAEKNTPDQKEDALSGLSEDARQVLRHLTETPLHLTELEAETGLVPARILAAVTELELEDLAETLSGNRYQRI